MVISSWQPHPAPRNLFEDFLFLIKIIIPSWLSHDQMFLVIKSMMGVLKAPNLQQRYGHIALWVKSGNRGNLK